MSQPHSNEYFHLIVFYLYKGSVFALTESNSTAKFVIRLLTGMNMTANHYIFFRFDDANENKSLNMEFISIHIRSPYLRQSNKAAPLQLANSQHCVDVSFAIAKCMNFNRTLRCVTAVVAHIDIS